MKTIKIMAIVCILIMLVIPVNGATTNNLDSHRHNCCRDIAYSEIEDYELASPANGVTTNNPGNHDYTFCKGFAFGKIKDYKLSPIAQLIYLLRGKPSTVTISRATVVIQQDPDEMSLELINTIKHYCMAYYGDITIHFYASRAAINLDEAENCDNCTHIVCHGFFGHIHVEQN